uniref:Uncharacterized protein P0587F01.3 n=1 Tax=Oryza sativa subsp. japonica TaxID=39947 RepID=C1AR02_ORYSJ|nr:hypothetical protein [Oryza sativa Japonica Group]
MHDLCTVERFGDGGELRVNGDDSMPSKNCHTAPPAGVHEVFRRGQRGDVYGAVAQLGLLRFDVDEDDVPMAASSACSRALSARSAFPCAHCTIEG